MKKIDGDDDDGRIRRKRRSDGLCRCRFVEFKTTDGTREHRTFKQKS